MKRLIIAIIVCGAAILIAYILSSCNTSKNVQKQNITSDSTRIEELEEQNKYLLNQVDELNTRISESQYTGVVFDNNCDSVIRSAITRYGCNADSINKIMDYMKARIKVYADGSTEYEGRIKQYTSQKQLLQEIVSKNQITIDSLKNVKQKTVHWVRTVTITHTKYKKTGFPWLVAIVSFALGVIAILLLFAWLAKHGEEEDPMDKIRIQHITNNKT